MPDVGRPSRGTGARARSATTEAGGKSGSRRTSKQRRRKRDSERHEQDAREHDERVRLMPRDRDGERGGEADDIRGVERNDVDDDARHHGRRGMPRCSSAFADKIVPLKPAEGSA